MGSWEWDGNSLKGSNRWVAFAPFPSYMLKLSGFRGMMSDLGSLARFPLLQGGRGSGGGGSGSGGHGEREGPGWNTQRGRTPPSPSHERWDEADR